MSSKRAKKIRIWGNFHRQNSCFFASIVGDLKGWHKMCDFSWEVLDFWEGRGYNGGERGEGEQDLGGANRAF